MRCLSWQGSHPMMPEIRYRKEKKEPSGIHQTVFLLTPTPNLYYEKSIPDSIQV